MSSPTPAAPAPTTTPPPSTNSTSPPPATSPPPSPAAPPPSTPTPPTSSPPPASSPPPPPVPPSSSPPPPVTPSPTSSPPPPPSPTNSSPSTPSTPSSPPPPTPPGVTRSPPPPSGTTRSSPPPPSPPRGASPPSSSSGVSTGLVVGIAIGGVLLLAFISILFVCCKKKKRRDQGPAGYYVPPPPGPKDDPYGGQPQQWQHNAPPPGQHVITMPPKPSPPPAALSRPPHSPVRAPSPQPPLPPPFMSSSGGSGSNYSGGSNPYPPPSPGMALGFSKRSTFSYEELAMATDGFSDANLLGQGGFGFVHRGVLPNGKEVAVKQLKAGSGQGEREFQAEVEIISRVHHKHLVSLVGYCMTGSQRLLVYEFVPNNTLEFHLHGHPKIIHRDIKAANILLDFNFEAKARPLLTRALEEGNFDTLVDRRLQNEYNQNEMARMVACAAACVRHSSRRRPRMSQVVRALEGDVSLSDLNEGIKPGHSSVYSSQGSSDYDTAQHKEDLKKFRKMALESQEYTSSEYSRPTSEYGLNPSGSSSEGQQTGEMQMGRMKKDSRGFSRSSIS
ncbi:hypothetical protein RJ639_001485 [Escallonia herrerae]|uniref:non-specific serine/threonine protein kinase n=1 Tax=Escallonia herrerae TaxID=1293975 RepID=A0AA88XMT1_9ASTE|nr:hypothetical protein RJ639_001485 [Escallonia herrerae]